MKKARIYSLLAILFSCVLTLSIISCDDDDNDPDTTIAIDKTTVSLKTGEVLELKITVDAGVGLEKLTIYKLMDDVVKETTNAEFTEEDGKYVYDFAYLIKPEDVDGILKFKFEAVDKNERTIPAELVVEVELSSEDILKKFDWKMSSEIRKDTDEEIIEQQNKSDNIHRFGEDYSYNIDYGAKNGNLDGLSYFCSWKLNEAKDSLFVTRLDIDWSTFLFSVEKIEKYKIESLDKETLKILITEDMTGFTGYNGETTFLQTFAAMPQTEDFVPYRGKNPPTGDCPE